MSDDGTPASGMDRCETCGVRDYGGEGSLIPVWEDPEDYNRGRSPDYLGCTDCHTMRDIHTETDQ